VLFRSIKRRDTQTHYFSAGFSYDKHNWVVQSEFALIASRWASIGMTNGYLSAGRRIGPVTLYTVGSYARSNNQPRVDQNQIASADLQGLAIATQNLLNAVHIDQNTVSRFTRHALGFSSASSIKNAVGPHLDQETRRWAIGTQQAA